MRPMPSDPANTPMTRNPIASGTPSRADVRLNVTASTSRRPKAATMSADAIGSVRCIAAGLGYAVSLGVLLSPLAPQEHTDAGGQQHSHRDVERNHRARRQNEESD